MRSFDDGHRTVSDVNGAFDAFRAAWWNGFATPALGRGPRPLEAPDRTPEWTGGATLEDEGDEYVLVMDLPGFEKEAIDLSFEDGALSVRASGDVERETGDADAGYVARTMRTRRVDRRIPIPTAVAVEEITATYRNGVLEVRLPVEGDDRETGHRIELE